MRTIRFYLDQVVHGWFMLLIVVLTAGIVGLLLLPHEGEHLLAVQTASMVPAFRPGDALIVAPVKVWQLHIGDIISYRSPQNAKVIITHRLMDIDVHKGQLTTAGDALHSADPPFSSALLVGRATALIPGLGRILDILHRPLGLIFIVYLPATFVLLAEAGRLNRQYQRPYYRLNSVS